MSSNLARVRPEGIREASLYKLEINNYPLTIRVSKDSKGKVNELYVKVDDQGTLVNGLMDVFSRMASRMLQYGIPLEEIVTMCKGNLFDPRGFVKGHPDIEMCDSIIDLVANILTREEKVQGTKEDMSTLDFVEKFINTNPHMKNEHIPINIVDFCEYIIQQNVSMAEEYFNKFPEVADEFAKHFEYTKGKLFYRGGYGNLESNFLCASESVKVAENFALYESNYIKGKSKDNMKGTGIVQVLTSEKFHRTHCDVDEEEEVFLWKPELLYEYRINKNKK